MRGRPAKYGGCPCRPTSLGYIRRISSEGSSSAVCRSHRQMDTLSLIFPRERGRSSGLGIQVRDIKMKRLVRQRGWSVISWTPMPWPSNLNSGTEEQSRWWILLSLTTSSRCTTSIPGSRERSEEHTSELQSRENLVCRLLLEKK